VHDKGSQPKTRKISREGEPGGTPTEEFLDTQLQKAQNGDEQARTELCEFVFTGAQKFGRIFGLPALCEIDDFAQDTVIEFVTQMAAIQHLRRWLSPVLVGQRARAFRRSHQRLFCKLEEAAVFAKSASLSAAEERRKNARLEFDILSKLLTLRQRQIVTLHCIDGMRFQDIADEIKMKPGTVRMHFMRAKIRLQAYLNLHPGEGLRHGPDD